MTPSAEFRGRTQAGQSFSFLFAGNYRVMASNDPSLPVHEGTDYFLSFSARSSGNEGRVAITARRNPHVKVRVFSWEYFPQSSRLVVGNPSTGDSRQALARVVWEIRASGDRVLLSRKGFHVMLKLVSDEEM